MSGQTKAKAKNHVVPVTPKKQTNKQTKKKLANLGRVGPHNHFIQLLFSLQNRRDFFISLSFPSKRRRAQSARRA